MRSISQTTPTPLRTVRRAGSQSVWQALATSKTCMTVMVTCIGFGAASMASAQSLSLPSTDTRAVPTFHSLGLYWTPGTNPGSAGCVIQYKKSSETAWKDGLAMWYDSRNSECRGSLVQLAAGTSYDIQFSLPGQAPVRQLRTQTWSEQFPIARTVTLPPGNSSQTLTITQGGSPTGYVLYTTDPSTPSVIDSNNAQTNNVQVNASYVIVRGLTLKGAQADAVRIGAAVHDVVIEDNDISGWGRSRGATSKFGYTLGVDMDAAVGANCVATPGSLERVIVQRNRIHEPRYSANSWTEGHPAGPQGITFNQCGGNHVFRYNDIYGTTGHYFNDAIGGAENFSTVGFPNSDSDIYGNKISQTWDDAIESEGANRNVRIWGNYLDQVAIGIASTPVATGPIYIFRNVENRSRQQEGATLDTDNRAAFSKSGSIAPYGGARRYLFHNTLLQATQAGVVNGLGAGTGVTATSSTQLIENTVSRNNIYQVWKTSYSMTYLPGTSNDFDYDLHNSTPGVSETHGILGTPTYASGNGWTSESGGMYQLASTSLGYDKGVRLANFNDAFTGAAPDIGAHEAGTPAMVFGTKGGTAPTPEPTPAPTPTPTPVPLPFSGTRGTLPGTIEAENFDLGGNGIAYSDSTKGNAGGLYRTTDDVDLIASCDSAGGGYSVGYIVAGEWLGYSVNVSTTGNYDIALRVANPYTQGTAHVEVDGVNVTGALSGLNTGSWCTFKWVTKTGVPLTAGPHFMKVVADQQYFDLNSIRVSAVAAPSSTPYSGTPVTLPGKIEAENFDKGGNGLAYYDSTKGNLGGAYRTGDDVDLIKSCDSPSGGYAVGYITSGEWLAYSVNVSKTANYDIALRLANPLNTGSVHVEVDGVDVTGPISGLGTSGWCKYKSVSKTRVPLKAGLHVLKVVVDQQYLDLNYINVTLSP